MFLIFEKTQNIMRKISSLLALGAMMMFLASCTDYGTKIEFGNCEIFYTKNVTENEGQKLGDFLQEAGYFKAAAEGASVQLDKEGDKYLVRFVVKEGIDKDEKYVNQMSTFLTTIQVHVFDGKTVEGHLCNSSFETLRKVNPKDFGKVKLFLGSEVFYKSGVTDMEAQKLGEYLVKEEFFQEKKNKSVQLVREGSDYIFRMVVREDLLKDTSMDDLFIELVNGISAEVVNGAKVHFEACDTEMVTHRRIDMKKEEAGK